MESNRVKVLVAAAALFGIGGAQANSTAQTLPFAQNWSDTGLITVNDDWAAVPGIVGYRGDDITAATGANPQTLTGEGSVFVNVIANQTNTAITNGGVAEFALANPVLALQGSGTADAPHLLINLDTSGQTDVTVVYNVRDIDGSADNAVQPVALQYRVGNSGSFIDVPAAFVADATSGPSLATQVTAVSAVLPAAANNQPLVQLRIITANAVGSDEWIGIDDLGVTGNGGSATLPTVSLSVEPAAFAEAGGSATVTATLSAPATSPVTVNLAYAGNAGNGSDYTASTAALLIPAGDSSASLGLSAIDDASFEGDETVAVSLGSLSGATAGSPNSVTATILDDEIAPPPTIGARIWQIQGAAHRSPLAGSAVSNVPGIVTARAGNGFYMQDGDGDGDVATSDGIFVFTSSAPPAAAAVGAQVLVSGTVSEFRPGNDAENLTITQIGAPTVTAYVGNALFTNTVIVPTILGSGGRIPPADIVDNDSLGNVEASTTTLFDPAEDGLDFHESLEGMLVQVNNAHATGPRNSFGEVWVLGDNGVNASGANARGGVTLDERATGIDFNPERIQLDDGLNGIAMPSGINTGDSLGTVTGVVSYSFDNFEVLLTAAPTVTANPLPHGVRTIAFGGDRLSVGAYNVENLDPGDTTFAAFGQQIAQAMGAPDILALSEIQDDNGATNNGVVSAAQTIQLLIDAIVAAGGPQYSAITVNPANNQDGGEPGGNIRLVQFYNPLRVSFVPGTAGAGGTTEATAPTLVDGRIALTLSPGRIEPTDTAWNASRKPLAATYDFNGRRLVVVNNHFNSKGGDQPLFGVNQPPVLSSEVQRRQQATLVNGFVGSIQALDPAARVIVLGDLNDFDFSAPLKILRTGVDGTHDTLRNLGTELIANPAERYSYVFEGNSQELDHVLATPSLLAADARYEAIHLNAEYAAQLSDHEPLLSSYLLPANVAPTAAASAAPATVTSGDAVLLDGTGSTDDGTIDSYAWTQTAGPAVSLGGAATATAGFTAPYVATTTTLSFSLRVRDDEGLEDTATTSVTVHPAVDTTPLPFSFAAKTEVALGAAVDSDSIVVLGINAPAAVTVTGGEYSINGGDFTAMLGAVVNNGDTVRLRQTASSQPSTTTTATLTIDSESADFRVTTVPPALTINDVSIAEGNAGTRVLRFTVSLSAPSPGPVSVGYTVVGDSATASSDFIAGAGTLNFAAGSTGQTVDVVVIGDLDVEADETLFVNLQQPSGATLADSQGLGTISNDDALVTVPTLSVFAAATPEGNSGIKNLPVTIKLSPAATVPVTVRATTVNGTALSGSDFNGGALSLTFAPGETLKAVNIGIRSDTAVEADETFTVTLANATGGAVIGRGEAVATILNDDSGATPPSINVADASVVEGNAGTRNLSFTVSLSAAATAPVTVRAATSNGTAISGSDFNGGALTVSFAPGETSKQVTVGVRGDKLVEADETFAATLSNATGGALIGRGTAIGTIINDD